MNRLAPLLLILPALLLAGCSVAYEPPASDSVDRATAPASAATGPAPEPPTPTPAAGTLRDQYATQADRTSCASGEVVVEQSAVILAIDGDCASIRVTGSGSVVLAERVGTLIVEGSATRIEVAEVETVSMSGSSNTVRWDAGEPTVDSTGAGNSARPNEG